MSYSSSWDGLCDVRLVTIQILFVGFFPGLVQSSTEDPCLVFI